MDNKEKKLRKDSSVIGFNLFFVIVLEIIIFVFIESFLRRSLYLNNQYDLIRKVADIFVYLFVSTIVFSLVLKIKGKNIKKIINLNFKKEKLFTYIVVSFFVIGFANFVATIFNNILKLVHIKSTMPDFNCGDTALSIFLSIIRIAIIPAIAEEFVFRGAILNLLKPYGKKFAILASSLLFGLLHGNVDQFIFAFLIGLYFAYIAYETESIIPSIIMHFLNNFLSLINTVYKSNNEISFILSEFALIAGIVGFIFFISMLFKNSKKLKVSNIFKKNKREKDIKFSDKVNAFIFNPGMILFLFASLIIFYFSIERVY